MIVTYSFGEFIKSYLMIFFFIDVEVVDIQGEENLAFQSEKQTSPRLIFIFNLSIKTNFTISINVKKKSCKF